MRAYTMQSVRSTADQAVALARELMALLEPQGRIHDVQDDPRFQHRGVDLLWDVPARDGQDKDRVLGVEVKGDRHGRRGNYFLELISNVEKDTPGCFLYSTADLVLYAFVRELEVHRLPLAPLREWFLPQARRFPTAQARTRAGTAHYTTVGALVPVKDVQRAVAGAARWKRKDAGAWDRKAVR
jgi:hypothetical protein